MSDTKQIWLILWDRASADPSPFEIDEALPEITSLLGLSDRDAARAVAGLLKELERMPDGRQFFALEGNAVVPLEEFARSAGDLESALDAYPFEI